MLVNYVKIQSVKSEKRSASVFPDCIPDFFPLEVPRFYRLESGRDLLASSTILSFMTFDDETEGKKSLVLWQWELGHFLPSIFVIFIRIIRATSWKRSFVFSSQKSRRGNHHSSFLFFIVVDVRLEDFSFVVHSFLRSKVHGSQEAGRAREI